MAAISNKNPQNALQDAKCVTVKIGSSLLVDEASGRINAAWLSALAEDIAALKQGGKQVLIVSSGAIALGRERLGLSGKLSLAQKQACAAAGQAVLTQAYEDVLSPHGFVTAQALLTLVDTEDRRRWINARATISELLALGAVPIINENDTVATDEIRYGDNDRLAARVSQMIGADCLVLLSDIDGLYNKDPVQHEDARHIPVIKALTPDIMKMGGGANQTRSVGSGGMATKLQAARIATGAGCAVAITKGSLVWPLTGLMTGRNRASWFPAVTSPVTARKQWIAGTLKPSGTLQIDDGAAKALAHGSSLLAAGVKAVSGAFQKGDCVSIVSEDGSEIGQGLAAYNAQDCADIMGLQSADIEAKLGYDSGSALIHRDNMVLLT